MTEAESLTRKRYQTSTSWAELFTELSDGMTTSTFRVGTPDDPDAPTVFKTYFPPNSQVPAHTHECDYAEIVLEGSQQVTRKWHYPGDIRIVKAGTAYGPLITGPEGATVILIFRDGRYSPVSLDGRDDDAFDRYQDGLR